MAVCRLVSIAVVLVALSFVSARITYAQPMPQVSLQFADALSAETTSRIVSSIRGQLSGLADASQRPLDALPAVLCQVQVTPRAGGLALTFVDTQGRALAGPRVVMASADELAASEAATIVRALVVALLDRPRTDDASALDVAPPEPAKTESTPATAPTPPRDVQPTPVPAVVGSAEPAAQTNTPPVEQAASQALPADATHLWLSALYSGRRYAPELLWWSGVRLEVALALPRWFYAGLSYGLSPAVTIPNDRASVRIVEHNLSVFIGVGRMGARFGWAGDVLFGLTRTLRETTLVADELEPTTDSARSRPLLAFRLRGRLRVPRVDRLVLELAPGLEIAAKSGFSIDDGQLTQVFSPYVVRARVDLGASLALF